MMAPFDAETVRVRIYGRVQGVAYRAWTVREATRLGLAGWVRNRADGSVEALLHGSRQAVTEMLARCRTGPRAAVVSHICEFESQERAPAGFSQRSTL